MLAVLANVHEFFSGGNSLSGNDAGLVAGGVDGRGDVSSANFEPSIAMLKATLLVCVAGREDLVNGGVLGDVEPNLVQIIPGDGARVVLDNDFVLGEASFGVDGVAVSHKAVGVGGFLDLPVVVRCVRRLRWTFAGRSLKDKTSLTGVCVEGVGRCTAPRRDGGSGWELGRAAAAAGC